MAGRVHAGLLLVQAGQAGGQLVVQGALAGGMSLFTFALYRTAIGACVFAPLAFFLERNRRPPLTWPLLARFFLLALTGIFISQAFNLEGLSRTSATFSAAMQNSIPAITFIIATAFGQEKVYIKRRDGQAKLLGTTLCVIGATIMVFYEGPVIIKGKQESTNTLIVSSITSYDDNATNYNGHPPPKTQLLQDAGPNYLASVGNYQSRLSYLYDGDEDDHDNGALIVHNGYPPSILGATTNWQLGAFYLVGMCISISLWLVMQGPVIKQYPAWLSVTAYTSFFGTLQVLPWALWEVRDEPSEWILSWGSDLLSVLYAGIVVSGLVFALQVWCVQKGGAVLTAVYQPTQTVIIAIFSFLFLEENFYLGSVIGGLLIMGGLYLVTWGQRKEKRFNHSLPTSLIPSSIVEEKSNTNIKQTLLSLKILV